MTTTDIDQPQPDQGDIRFEFSVLDEYSMEVAGGDAPTYAEAERAERGQ